MDQSSNFIRLGTDTWVISPDIDPQRRDALHNAPLFPRIVDAILASIVDVALQREHCGDLPGHHRVGAVITCGTCTPVDWFHNAASGYRAQYLEDPKLGGVANRLIATALGSRLLQQVSQRARTPWDIGFARMSVLAPDAKVWTKQGLWLRRARRDCSDLLVEKWTSHSNSPVEEVRRRVRYGRQLPGKTASLEFKGAWFNDSCQQPEQLPKSSATRAGSINMHGFT